MSRENFSMFGRLGGTFRWLKHFKSHGAVPRNFSLLEKFAAIAQLPASYLSMPTGTSISAAANDFTFFSICVG